MLDELRAEYTWERMAAFAALAPAVGGAVDLLFLGRQQKTGIHAALRRWWDWLARTHTIDLPQALATTAGNLLRPRLVPFRRPVTFVLATAVVSWLLTTAAFTGGNWLEGSFTGGAMRWHDYLPFIGAYVGNYLCDLASGGCPDRC